MSADVVMALTGRMQGRRASCRLLPCDMVHAAVVRVQMHDPNEDQQSPDGTEGPTRVSRA
jgi:hypothetical protein